MTRLLVSLLLVLLGGTSADAQTLRIFHIDVDQADAALVVMPNGKTLLIDSGKNGSGPRLKCAGLQEHVRLVNNKAYPGIADDFARSIKKYKSLPADVFLGAHSWFFDLAGKYKRLGSGVNPYVDPAGYKAWVDTMERNYNSTLAEQKKNP